MHSFDIESIARDVAKIYTEKQVTCENSVEEIRCTYLEIFNETFEFLKEQFPHSANR